ncbi:MAG: ShlB/FhaC/HecB family hemolysin secretion/activation protein [Firmicutes bacterium]|nr:ShlB/FhaC/HecB family hemolysin secretion/activation protein [Bacillota bacterium]
MMLQPWDRVRVNQNRNLITIARIFMFALGFIYLLTGVGMAQDMVTDDPLFVEVRKVIINDSEILTEEEIRAIIDPMVGRRMSMEQLQAIIDQINELYAEKNFITARAILPPQTIADGVVQIELVEGTVGDIVVEGNRATRVEYFLKRLSLQQGDLVRLDVLEKDLSYFNATNDVQVRAEITAGKEFGLTDFVLRAVEPTKTQVVAFVDNGGREETGLYRLGVTAVNNSLFGIRDTINVSATYAQGTLGINMAYDVPVSRRGARLAVNYDRTKTAIVSGTFEAVGIEGLSSNMGVRVSHPILVKPQGKLSGALGWQAKQTDNYFSGVKLQSARLQTTLFSLTGQFFRNNQSWSGQQEITLGHVELPDEGDFLKFFGTITWQRALHRNGLLTVQGLLQLTNDQLLPFSEQLSLGGMSIARGYPEGTLIGDKGFAIRGELTYPIGECLRGMVFLDYGGVFPYKGNDESVNEEDYLASCGLGATVNIGERVSANVVVGWPIGRKGGSPQIHLFLQTKLW